MPEESLTHDAAGAEGERLEGTPKSFVLLVCLGLLSLFNYRGLLQTVGGSAALGQTLGEALYDPGVTSPLLGLVVFFVLAVLRRARVREQLGKPPAWAAGLSCLGLGSGLLAWSHEIAAPDLLMPSFVFQVIGLALLLGGPGLLRALGMPILALVVAIPVPVVLLHQVVFPMQLGTAALTSGLLDLIGRSHVLAGDQIYTHGVIFQVIEGCSGMKSTLSLLLAAVAYADLSGRNAGEKLVLVALALPIGFLTNGFRVLALVLGEIPAESAQHEAYGIAMVVVGVVLLAVTEIILSRTLFEHLRRRKAKGQPIPASADTARTGEACGDPSGSRPIGPASLLARASGLTAGTLALAIGLASFPPGTFTEYAADSFNIERLPREIAGLRAKGIRLDDRLIGTVAFRHRLMRQYEGEGVEPIRVFIGIEDDFRRDRSGYARKTALPRSGWLSIERVEDPSMTALGGERLLVRYPGESILVDHFRLGYAPWAAELFRSWFGWERLAGRRSSPAIVVRVESTLTQGDRSTAEVRLRQFRDAILNWYESAG